MPIRVAINGFGRIGRMAFRAIAEQPEFADLQVVAINDLLEPDYLAYLLRHELFAGRRINVEIETGSALTMGTTVADWRGVSGRAANATFLHAVDAPGFYALLGERLARLP